MDGVTMNDDSGLVAVPSDFAQGQPASDEAAPMLPQGTVLHAADPGTGVTHVRGPTGAVVPVATSFLTPADHKMLGTQPGDDRVNGAIPDPRTLKDVSSSSPDLRALRAGAAPTTPQPAPTLPGGSAEPMPVDSRPYASEVQQAAAKYPAATPDVMHAILDQESKHGTAAELDVQGPAGRGDGGHGHGLGQIDDRSHQDFLVKKDANGTPLWQKPDENIKESARIYQDAYDRAKAAGVPEKDLQEVALNGYNHGPESAIAAYRQGTPLAYAQLVQAKIGAGSNGTTAKPAPSPAAAPQGPLRPPTPDQVEQAKTNTRSVLGQFVRTVEDPKSGQRIVTTLGSDGKTHDWDYEQLKQKSPQAAADLANKFGSIAPSFFGGAKTPGVMDAIKSGVGYAPNVAADVAHPVASNIASGVKKLGELNPLVAPIVTGNKIGQYVGGKINDAITGKSDQEDAATAAQGAEIKPNITQPAAPVDGAPPQSGTPPAPTTTAPTVDPDQAKFDHYSKNLDDAFDAQRSATGQAATDEAKQSDAVANAMNQGANDAVSADKNLDTAYKGLQGDYKKRFDATIAAASDLYKRAAVNPDALYANASTGRHILGTIGQMFSNIGATYLGATPVDLISKAIDRDTEIQQNSFRNAQRAGAAIDSAYGQLVQGGLSEVEAAHVLKMTGLETAKLRIAAIMQGTNSPVILDKGKQAVAALDAKIIGDQVGLAGQYDEHRIRSAQADSLDLRNKQAAGPQPDNTNPENNFVVKGNHFALPGAKPDADAKALPAQADSYETAKSALEAMRIESRKMGSSFSATGAGTSIAANAATVEQKIESALGGKDNPVARSLVNQYRDLFKPKFFQTQAAYEKGLDALQANMTRAIDERFKSKGLPAYSTIQSPADAKLKSATTSGNFTPIGQ